MDTDTDTVGTDMSGPLTSNGCVVMQSFRNRSSTTTVLGVIIALIVVLNIWLIYTELFG
jgi:Mn2+/Fe2+ NRAMP family transporter